MKRYQRIVRETVRAQRFDNPARPPQGVKKTGHPRAPFVAEVKTGAGNQSLVQVELGDWIVHTPGSTLVLNHDRFMEQFTEIKTVDGEDVTEQYRPAKRKELTDEEPHSEGPADAEVPPEGGEGQDEVQPEGEA